jgi:hypothetical protein
MKGPNIFDRREEEFRRRLLAALEKPPTHRLYRAINSPFILWLLSALLITIGGAYLSNHRTCVEGAQKDIVLYERLASEIFYRRLRLLRLANTSGTIIDCARHPKTGSLSTTSSTNCHFES